MVNVGFTYFGGEFDDMIYRKVPAKRIPLANGETALVATVFDLMVASYGVDKNPIDPRYNCEFSSTPDTVQIHP